jgi:hypothetical protein
VSHDAGEPVAVELDVVAGTPEVLVVMPPWRGGAVVSVALHAASPAPRSTVMAAPAVKVR